MCLCCNVLSGSQGLNSASMTKIRPAFLFFTCFLLLYSAAAFGQENLNDFGKNRIQYKVFNWRYFSSDNFDVYYYDNGDDNARHAITYLEDNFEEITEVIGYAPYSKIKIFLYNSVTDLQQSNVGVNESSFTVGGQTNFVKAQIEVAFPGTQDAFQKELVEQVTMMLINDMMFGGSLTDMFQNSYLLTLPEWFMSGAARYVAEGWSVEMDGYVRDLMMNGKFKRLHSFKGEDAAIVGQSIWNFVAEKYGRSNISNILNLTRIIRNEENSISNTLGLPFKQFLREWVIYYKEMEGRLTSDYVVPDRNNILDSKREYYYHQIKISPNGQSLAYAANYKGKYKVFIRDLQSGRETLVLTEGTRVINQEVDYQVPLLAWRGNTSLGVITSEQAKYFLWTYDISTGRKQKKEFERFSHINSIDFSENGNLAIFSAERDGRTDLYIYSIRRNAVKRITNDLFDDIDAKFVPNSTSIVFASNRFSDSLSMKDVDFAELNANYNLFIYNLDTTGQVLTNLTRTVSTDKNPVMFKERKVLFLSDQRGITNLYSYNIDERVYHQVTNYIFNIKNYDYNPITNVLVYTMQVNGMEHLYIKSGFTGQDKVFPVQTVRQEVMQAKSLSQRIRKQRAAEESEKIAVDKKPETPVDEEGLIDTDNYVFDSEVRRQKEKKANPASSILSYVRSEKTPSITGPTQYRERFSADNVVTSWVVDPLLGFGIKLETQMNDMLENHKFYGGILATSDLRSGNIFGEYQYLKYRLDFKGRYSRKTLLAESEEVLQRYNLNSLEAGMSYPLSITSRISFTPFYQFTTFYDLEDRILRPIPANPPNNLSNPTDQSQYNYLGFRASFVFDNSIVRALNLLEGTRGKLEFTHHESVEGQQFSFSQIDLDVRNYFKIHRELVFATRFYYGRFFGASPKRYLLGGMDNWLFNKSDINGGINDPLFFTTYKDNSDILFAEYLTNLRGFDYNKFNGQNAMLFNAELRFPIIRYFYGGPIASNFFRNLQLTGFFDIGSSWNGNELLPSENSLNTVVIDEEGSAFVARIRNFNNPWLYSYGGGVRTVMLGYYMKFDVAWPVEDYNVGSTRFYVTLGYDF